MEEEGWQVLRKVIELIKAVIEHPMMVVWIFVGIIVFIILGSLSGGGVSNYRRPEPQPAIRVKTPEERLAEERYNRNIKLVTKVILGLLGLFLLFRLYQQMIA